MAQPKYIPGTRIAYTRAKSAIGHRNVREIQYLAEDGHAIPICPELEDAGFAASPGKWPWSLPRTDTITRIVLNPLPDTAINDPRLEVHDINGRSVRRYISRAALDATETEILRMDRQGISLAKINRDGRNAFSRARTDAHNTRLLALQAA